MTSLFDTADRRAAPNALLANIKRDLDALGSLLERVSSEWGYQDPIYRFWHQSFKVYGLQEETTAIVTALEALAPEGCELHEWFRATIASGTGITFEIEHNQRWLEMTRPILEAFFHARFMLEMAVTYGHKLEEPPSLLPSGWAALLYLYDLR